MKPVFQQIVDPDIGGCFSAALASLLELDIDEVPKFRRDYPSPDNYIARARRWLINNFGLSLLTLQMEDLKDPMLQGKDRRIIGGAPNTPCLAGGLSPNIPGAKHCVVGKLDDMGVNFIMTHDPNPSGKGIEGLPIHLYFLIPIKPEVLARV